jgi:TetR/AcrR family transcriptional regulator
LAEHKETVRDPEGTKRLVLDAAEALFAEKGYDAVSLAEVGVGAGVSRGTPSYFFGSKKGLYRAVVERMVEDVQDFDARTRPGSEAGAAGRRAQKALAFGIEAYIDFLASRPNFIKLMEREVLDAERLSGEDGGLPSLSEHLGDPGRDFLGEQLGEGPFRDVDAGQLIVSIIALCFFPFAHADGLLKQLGADPYNPAFVEQRKRHVIDLVLNGILAKEQGEERRP